MLVRAKKKRFTKGSRDVRSVTRCIFSLNRFASILAIIPASCVLYNKCGQLSRQQTHSLRVAANCTTHSLYKAQNLMTHPLSAPAQPPPPVLFDQSLTEPRNGGLALGCTGTGSPMVNHVGPNTSYRQGYKMVSAMPADSSETLQLCQRNDGPEPATISRDLYILYKNKGRLIKENISLDLFAMVLKSTIQKKEA